MFSNRFRRYGEERQPKLYLSNVGRPLRQLWYELKGYRGEPIGPEAKFKFLYGDLLEALVLFLAVEAGHDVQLLQHKVVFDGIPGRIDAVIDGVLVDVKSCSTASFDKFQTGKILTEDAFGYIFQLSSYKAAIGIGKAAFIAVDKTLGKLCSFTLPDGVGGPGDLRERIVLVREAIKSDVEPARCYEPKRPTKNDKTGNLILDVGCQYCAFKQHCWRDCNDGQGLQERIYSTGPKWFVKLVKEPRLKYDFTDDDDQQEQEETNVTFPKKNNIN